MTEVKIERGARARETITVTTKSGFAFRVVVYKGIVFLHGATVNEKLRIWDGDKAIEGDTFGLDRAYTEKA